VSRVLLLALLGAAACHSSGDVVVAPPPACPEPVAALERACEGSRLDLAWIDMVGVCVPDEAPESLQPGVVRFEPAEIVVAPGEDAWLELVYANDDDGPRTIGVDYCDLTQIRRVGLYQGEERVDRVEVCGGGGGCGGPTHVLDLDAHGSARLLLPVGTLQRRQAADCSYGEPVPLPPGRYEARLQVGDHTATAVVEIRTSS